MTRDEYARRWSSVTRDLRAEAIRVINIPEDIEVRAETFPCSYCGTSATVPCRHRPWMKRAA